MTIPINSINNEEVEAKYFATHLRANHDQITSDIEVLAKAKYLYSSCMNEGTYYKSALNVYKCYYSNKYILNRNYRTKGFAASAGLAARVRRMAGDFPGLGRRAIRLCENNGRFEALQQRHPYF